MKQTALLNQTISIVDHPEGGWVFMFMDNDTNDLISINVPEELGEQIVERLSDKPKLQVVPATAMPPSP